MSAVVVTYRISNASGVVTHHSARFVNGVGPIGWQRQQALAEFVGDLHRSSWVSRISTVTADSSCAALGTVWGLQLHAADCSCPEKHAAPSPRPARPSYWNPALGELRSRFEAKGLTS